MTTRQPTPGVHENFAADVSPPARTTSSGLLPCPFCGGDRLKHFGKEIQCQQCQALGPLPADGEVTYQIAIDWWNRRTTPAPESHVIPPHVRNFLGKVQGVCMGVAMSGDSHPDPGGALMGLFHEAQELLFPAATTEGSDNG